ncbi:MarR family winged helix-turn-helix transcriptional regulator [Luteithermobacter gelatinilyticus]|uniref:MarR family winged helix-turn-helix transcriptional regulator n=1 Tax=Luteithermobacter gelatinilyticus TaxID=2582913 RepID=UPI00143CD116|nr:MarR family transcriptional regulator [Luteithermobacter gelatinilyticus]
MMSLGQALDHVQRYLARRWQAERSLRPLTFSEYDYLKSVERLEQIYHHEHQGEKRDFHGQGAHLSQLAETLQVQRASASTMVKKLEERGLIERVRCQYDSRAWHILLTRDGRDLLEKESRVYDLVAHEIQDLLTPEEGVKLTALLTKVCRNL